MKLSKENERYRKRIEDVATVILEFSDLELFQSALRIGLFAKDIIYNDTIKGFYEPLQNMDYD